MTQQSTCSLDDLRVLHPDIGIAIYAYEPGAPVTLEAHTPDGGVFSWKADTLAEAVRLAFPDEVAADEADETPTIDIFS